MRLVSLLQGSEGLPVQEIERRTRAEHGMARAVTDLVPRADRLLVLRYARSPTTRKRRLYLENEQKLLEDVPPFQKVLVPRNDNARLLGFKSHAEFRLQDRITASIDSLDDMLCRMRE